MPFKNFFFQSDSIHTIISIIGLVWLCMCTIISWCLLLLVVVAAATGWFSRLFISWWKMWKLPANCNWVGQFSSAAATTTTWCDMMCIVVIYYILLVTWMEVNRCFLSKDRQQKSSSSRSEMSFKQISSSCSWPPAHGRASTAPTHF